MTTPLTNLEPAAPLPSDRAIWLGVVNRLVLPVLAIVLALWNLLFLFNSWVLMPANDFGRIYHSAQAFVEGRDMYAWNPSAPSKLEEDYAIDLYNMNPPHAHLLFLPFTLLDGDYAFLAWWVLSGVCLFSCLRWILAELDIELTPGRRRAGVLLLLAFSGTTAMLGTAQLSFVLLVPITLMWLAARRRLWGWSGFFLGVALSVKPFLGVVLAYFVWRRHWRAAAACLLTVIFCFGIGVAVFGIDNHLSWRHRLADSEGWAWLPMNASLMGMLVRSLSSSVWYAPVAQVSVMTLWTCWFGIGVSIGLATLVVTQRGSAPADLDRNFALVLIASVLLSPLGWIYYLWLALPPVLGVWANRRQDTEATEQQRLPRWLIGIAFVAFIWPIIGTRLFQPDSHILRTGARNGFQPAVISTLSLGNIYFWGLLAFWMFLVQYAWKARKYSSEHGIPSLRRLDPADYRISVVMPVFSETDSVRQIATWLMDELGSRLEEILIIQSPRSSEESRSICRKLTAEYPAVRLYVQQNNPGLGNAVRQGYAAIRGNLVLHIDSDGEMELDSVPHMLEVMARDNPGLVVASRWLRGGGFSGYGGMKYYLNWCFQQAFRWLFWTRLHDLTYGYKLMRAELVHGIRWEGTLHEIACETTLKPVRLGVAVAEVPSKWTARTQGVSKNTFWRNFRYVRMALAILVRGVSNVNRPAEDELPPRSDQASCNGPCGRTTAVAADAQALLSMPSDRAHSEDATLDSRPVEINNFVPN